MRWFEWRETVWCRREMNEDFSAICGIRLSHKLESWILYCVIICSPCAKKFTLINYSCLLEAINLILLGNFKFNWQVFFSVKKNQKCDLLVQDVAPLFYRSQIDMTTPWIFSNYALLIPVAGETANINAIIKPMAGIHTTFITMRANDLISNRIKILWSI